MDEIKNGGPAFPTKDYLLPPNRNEIIHYGMSLRDWFAGMALNGITSNPELSSRWYENYLRTHSKEISDVCYCLASEMIKRKENESS